MHEWYSHPYTHVLLVTSPLPNDLPSGMSYSNSKAYHQRGWCFYEMRVAALVKHRTLLWDLGKYQATYPFASATYADAPSEDYFGCCRLMAAKRPVPMSPEDVGKEFRARVARTDDQMLSFSYSADLEPVIDLYRRGFVSAIESFPENSSKGSQISFQGLQWDDSTEATLVATWTYAVKHCNPSGQVRVNMARNKFSKKGSQRISDVFRGKITLSGI